ncbi:putative TIM-barrel fold metal-dependent hydrolase [Rubricella aquisinus]|uniref:Putative TIM-barrel fold metal-dependent hydrolase n=1 Tax=Rubricella aquisinus TaxID=2028108 RepID=A0A840WJK5_9RHOB|nr:amidohydrolase family protein [Rubricella aquisinus]MBB5514701.1 putative TIM-barrel fold metal-dependent hydrolase [Rubricella aquisinus]
MIDAHHHLWDLNAVSYPWLEAEGVERFFGNPAPIQRNYLVAEHRQNAEAVGITASVHIQVGAADPWAEAIWVDQVAQQDGAFPAAQVAFCDLTADDRDAALDRLQSLKSVRGVRQIVGRAPGEDQVTGTGALVSDPRFLEGLRAVATRGLSFDLQLIPEQYAAMAHVLGQVADLNVVLCHAGSPHDRSQQGLAQWAEALCALSARPNTFCKLSGLGMFDHDWTQDSIRPIVSTVLDQFGAARVMVGSNFPVDSLYSSYTAIWEAYDTLTRGLTPTERQAIMGDTARGFYGLGS